MAIFLTIVLMLSTPAPDASANLVEIAGLVARKAARTIDVEDYKGSVYLQGLAELYDALQDSAKTDSLVCVLRGFGEGTYKGFGSFISYKAGGNATPYLAFKGFDSLRAQAVHYADSMWTAQKRNRSGLMVPPWDGVYERDSYFIDCAFAVCPYLLYSGLLEDRGEYIDFAVETALRSIRMLRDPSTGLVHQAYSVKKMKDGTMTDDCWSRGNGWAAVALVPLMRDLPHDHPEYNDVRKLSRDFLRSALKYQDREGLWHQEMTWADSYAEISGSALLLYGVGAAIESGVLPKRYMKNFRRGLVGLLSYISPDGDVGNTCSGCLAWGDGSKAAYAAHACYTNENHSFGPVLLALSQAVRLRITAVDVKIGTKLEGRLPKCYVRYIDERKGDIAWENDCIAFRIYSQQVKAKVSSGVDLWTKSVDYSIIDKWYARNAKGDAYHIDAGEGYDFYAVGRNRGVGGTGIWYDGALYVPEPFSEYKIIFNSVDSLSFEIIYPEFCAGPELISQTKTIKMVKGTYFYQVTDCIRTASGNPAVLAVGLTEFGNASVCEILDEGIIYMSEKISDKDGSIGSAIVVNPSQLSGSVSFGKDRLVMIPVKSGEVVTYYVGAAWSGDLRFDPFSSKWPKMLRAINYEKMTDIYEN